MIRLAGRDTQTQHPTLNIRNPRPEDAAAIHELVASSALDTNSAYLYLLICSHFAATSLVVEDAADEGNDTEGNDRLLGFVAAYRPPDHPEAVFVWQIGIAPDARGRGLATVLLDRLMDLPACAGARYLEATVTPSNQASQRLFHGFARRCEVSCAVADGFDRTLFPQAGHESEELYRIGPFPAS